MSASPDERLGEQESDEACRKGKRTGASQETKLSVELWAERFLTSTQLSEKCDPGPCALPEFDGAVSRGSEIVLGRPAELKITREFPKSAKWSALSQQKERCGLIHKFWHHELQAAELMAWAILRFPETNVAFRRGLLGICRDELRHMKMYEAYLGHHGYALGSFPVRDWIWERVSKCQSPIEFVALLGMGFEGANLDHAQRYADRFCALGDEMGARIQEQVAKEEIPHVAFALHWFTEWTGQLDFEQWRAHLPADLGPLSVRGKVLQTLSRQQAGMDAQFLEALQAWRTR